MTLTITTSKGVEIVLNPGPFEFAARGIINRNVVAPGKYDIAHLNTPQCKITLADTSKVCPSSSRHMMTRERAEVVEGFFRQLFPTEFNTAEVGAASAAAAQN